MWTPKSSSPASLRNCVQKMGRRQDEDSSSDEDDDDSSSSSGGSSTSNSNDSATDSSSNDSSSSSSGSEGEDSEIHVDENENFEVGFWQSLKGVMPWTDEGREVNTFVCLALQLYNTCAEFDRSPTYVASRV